MTENILHYNGRKINRFPSKYDEWKSEFVKKYPPQKEKPCAIPIHPRKQLCLVDYDDYHWLMQWNWQVDTSDHVFRTKTVNGKRRAVFMHREIIDCADDKIVDHINGIPWDNRRCNLRECSYAQNRWNRGKPNRKNPSTKYKGVHRNKMRQKFEVKICSNGETHHLGFFDDVIKAAKTYDKKARELHGEFAVLNFPG